MINLNNVNVGFKSRMLASDLGKSGTDEVVSLVRTQSDLCDRDVSHKVHYPILSRPYQQGDNVVITYADEDKKIIRQSLDANSKVDVVCLDGEEGREKRVYA